MEFFSGYLIVHWILLSSGKYRYLVELYSTIIVIDSADYREFRGSVPRNTADEDVKDSSQSWCFFRSSLKFRRGLTTERLYSFSQSMFWHSGLQFFALVLSEHIYDLRLALSLTLLKKVRSCTKSWSFSVWTVGSYLKKFLNQFWNKH